MSALQPALSRRRWWAFALAAGAALAALGTVSSIVLDHERFQVEEQSVRGLEARLDTTAWRIQSVLLPIFAAESARPEQEWSPMVEELDLLDDEGRPLGRGFAPSPLLRRPNPVIFTFYFEWEPGVGFRTPHLPATSVRASLIERGWTDRDSLRDCAIALSELEASSLDEDLADFLRGQRDQPAPRPLLPRVIDRGDGSAPELALLRVADSPTRVQGVFVNWALLRSRILASEQGLVRDARLVGSPAPVDAGRKRFQKRLALMPVEFELDAEAPAPPEYRATRVLLSAAWIGTVIGLIALGVALRSTLRESARRGRFASLVSHELRTPLTTFKMVAGMLARGMVSDEARREEYYRTLVDESERLERVVDNVLLHTRVEQRGHQTTAAPTSLADLLGRVVDDLERRALNGGMLFETTDPRELPPEIVVRADADAVGQILGNLVDNAVKYGADTEQPILRFVVQVQDRVVALRVEDDGPGVPAGFEKDLFKPFVRHDATSDRPGVGLGLPLARGLARDSGGDLTLVRDGRERGATFELSLPRLH